MDLHQAREIFERSVLASNEDWGLVEGETLEYPACFVFFYQSKKFLETGDWSEILVGHGPVFINRENGRVFETGSAQSVSHYITAFEACGDPLGKPTEKVKIFAWNPGANKVRAMQLVRQTSALGLSQAKAVIDNALSNEEPSFSALTVEDAEHAVIALQQEGFDSVQLWTNQS